MMILIIIILGLVILMITLARCDKIVEDSCEADMIEMFFPIWSRTFRSYYKGSRKIILFAASTIMLPGIALWAIMMGIVIIIVVVVDKFREWFMKEAG